MNIFYLDSDSETCAKMHNSKHCIKMILEYSQLLSTAHRILDGVESSGKSISGRNKKVWRLNDERDTILYSSTHISHPSSVWSRKSDSNYKWLHSLLVELCKEYTYRYGRIHKCESTGLVEALLQIPNNIPVGNFTEPTPAMPEQYVVPNDSILSYRNYYNNAKQHLAEWSGKINTREIPEWYIINTSI